MTAKPVLDHAFVLDTHRHGGRLLRKPSLDTNHPADSDADCRDEFNIFSRDGRPFETSSISFLHSTQYNHSTTLRGCSAGQLTLSTCFVEWYSGIYTVLFHTTLHSIVTRACASDN